MNSLFIFKIYVDSISTVKVYVYPYDSFLILLGLVRKERCTINLKPRLLWQILCTLFSQRYYQLSNVPSHYETRNFQNIQLLALLRLLQIWKIDAKNPNWTRKVPLERAIRHSWRLGSGLQSQFLIQIVSKLCTSYFASPLGNPFDPTEKKCPKVWQ